MTEEARDWLPPDSFGVRRLRTAWQPLLDAWQAHWFRKYDHVELRDGQGGSSPLADGEVTTVIPGVALRVHKASRRTLLSNLLGKMPGGGELSMTDRVLIDRLIEATARDLVFRLSKSFGTYEIDDPNRCHLELWLGSGRVFTVTCPTSALIAPIKSAIIHRSAGRAIAARMAALSACELPVWGVLGHCEISVAELRDLERGDVLVLDNRHDGMATLQSLGATEIARGTLVDADGRNGVLIQ